MHINLQREELLKPLSAVAGVVEKRQTLPILSFILLKQTANQISLTGTDLEVEVVAELKSKQEGEHKLTLPARKFLDICKALPENAIIDLRNDGDKAILKSGKSRFTLQTLPVSDFPDIQSPSWDFSFDTKTNLLRSALLETQFCMAQQDMRYFLNGLLFELTADKLKIVGTDGHRMAVSEVPIADGPKSVKQVIVPRKGIHEITRLLDGDGLVNLSISQNHIRIATNTYTLISKLIDGKYPDYTKVIPEKHSKYLRISRDEIKESLGRISILSNEKYRGVRLTLVKNSLKISTNNPEQEEAIEEVSADYAGDEIEVGFNVNYMIDAISSLTSKEIVIGLTDPNSSCTISSAQKKPPLYVIMPMRL